MDFSLHLSVQRTYRETFYLLKIVFAPHYTKVHIFLQNKMFFVYKVLPLSEVLAIVKNHNSLVSNIYYISNNVTMLSRVSRLSLSLQSLFFKEGR